MKKLKKLKVQLYFALTLLFLAIPDTAFGAKGELWGTLQKGTNQMISDIQKFLIITVPSVAGVALLASAGMRAISNEEDKSKWDRRMKQAIIFSVVAILATAIITTVLGYFK